MRVKFVHWDYFLLFVPIFFYSLTFYAFYRYDGFNVALNSTIIVWSLYTLLIPGFHGSILLGIPYKIIKGKKLLYPELITWPLALLTFIYFYLFDKKSFYQTIPTHLLYEIISEPNYHKSIILVSGVATLYRAIIGYNSFYKYRYLNYSIRSILIVLSLVLLFFFSYTELIILFNLVL